MKRQRGDAVLILDGMPEFIGQAGEIIDDSDRDGSTIMYRVRLYTPVNIEGLGPVEDDLWAGRLLRKLRPSEVAKYRDAAKPTTPEEFRSEIRRILAS